MNDNENEQLVQIEWRLYQMMAERNIRTITALRKKLLELDVDISSQQASRIVNQFPERMNTKYLRGLLTVLDCDISDLIRVHPPLVPAETAEEQPKYSSTSKKPKTVNKKVKVTKKPKAPVTNLLPPGFDE